ncbi:MAG: IclR family transcriptional regulator [Pseudomonadota bacterium]
MSGGTVGKAMDVLDQVATHGRPVRFASLLSESDLPKATLYRLLQTLCHEGLVSFDRPSQTYSLGMRLVRLAHGAWAQSSLAPIARPHLDRLSEQMAQTVHLAQLDAGQVLYVDKRNAAQPIDMFSDAGKVGPAYCTGVGKAMLAFLPLEERDRALAQQSYHRFTDQTLGSPATLTEELEAIRARGYAFDREEHEPGIICVAVPILSPQGRVLGALSITGSTRQITLDDLAAAAPLLMRCATNIASEAEAWRFPDTTLQNTGT